MARQSVQMAQTKVLDTTREMVQRVQVGLAGLLGVLAIIALAGLMTRNARVDDSGLTMSKEGTSIADSPSDNTVINPAMIPNEPLADLGVTPSSETSKPSDVNSCGAIVTVAPLAQSTTSRLPAIAPDARSTSSR